MCLFFGLRLNNKIHHGCGGYCGGREFQKQKRVSEKLQDPCNYFGSGGRI